MGSAWRPYGPIKFALDRGQAVVQRKKKARQATVGPLVSSVDELYAVLAGELEFFAGGRWRPAPPRTIGFFPRRRTYGIRARAGYSGRVEVVSTLFRAATDFRPGLPSGPVRLTGPWWRRYLDLEAHADFDDQGQRVLSAGEIERFVERLARAVAPSAARRRHDSPGPLRADTEADWLEVWSRAEDAIRERAARGLTVDELARAVHVSATQLRRVFQAGRGISPKAALTAWRIERAKELLAGGRWNATQVARLVGYSTVQRFSSAFKQAAGETPGAFAQRR